MKRLLLATVVVALIAGSVAPIMADGVPIPDFLKGWKYPKWPTKCFCPSPLWPEWNCQCNELNPGPNNQLCYIDWLRGLGTYIGEDDDYLYFEVTYDVQGNYYLQTTGAAPMSLSKAWAESFTEYCD